MTQKDYLDMRTRINVNLEDNFFLGASIFFLDLITFLGSMIIKAIDPKNKVGGFPIMEIGSIFATISVLCTILLLYLLFKTSEKDKILDDLDKNWEKKTIEDFEKKLVKILEE